MAQLLFDRDEAQPSGSKEYRAIKCPACSEHHFVNIATGRLMSDEIED
jgi:hypothetical protein